MAKYKTLDALLKAVAVGEVPPSDIFKHYKPIAKKRYIDRKFIVIYVPTNSQDGKWQIDTDENGDVASYVEFEEAFDRVDFIRSKGGKAQSGFLVEKSQLFPE